MIPYRLSQSPSLLVSGSSYRPQREGLIPCSASNLQEEFSSSGFNPITNGFYWCAVNQLRHDHATWNVTWSLLWSKFNWTLYFLRAVFRCRFISCIQIQSFSGRFIFLHLSTLQRSDFPGSHGAKKHYLLFWARALESFWFFYVFFYGLWARKVWRLNSQMLQDGPFFHYPIFVLKIPLFTFSNRNFFPLFVCFDILWQLATTNATGTQKVRDKIASLDASFCRGNKSSSRPLARFCRRKLKKSTARASRWWKNLSWTRRQV